MSVATQKYINDHIADVMSAIQGSKLFPEVVIAQGALESANGQSALAKIHNNYYGIKASRDWKGKVITMKTDEFYNGVKSNISGTFRAYNSFLESTKDYVKFLKENKRYTLGGVFDANTIEEQVQALKNSGYATAPTYVSNVMSVIKSNASYLQTSISNYVKTQPYKAIAFILLIGVLIYGGNKLYKLNK
jgi:flagellum-specific peptidoglycan hydrolase FlgJ